MTDNTIGRAAEGPQTPAPLSPNAPEWMREAQQRAELGQSAPTILTPEADRQRSAEMMENYRKGEEAAQKREETALKREMVKRGMSPDASTGPRQLVGRELGSVQMHAIEWLWTGWIPKGYITIFAGETGASKSTLLADITGRVTTGAPWPGEFDCPNARRAPERVLWLGSEDSMEEMTIPRLVACGANRSNVVEIQGVMQQGKRNTFSLQDDLEQVADWLARAKAEGLPFAMLVIDPVTSYLPGQKLRRVDLNDAGQLRTVLEPWLILAQTHNVAIVCVTHFAKDTNRAMLHRVLGSAAFAQTCRSLCAVIEQPTREDEEPDPHAKVLMQVKVNLPEHPGGAWKFHTERVEVGTDHRNGKPVYATRPVWDELDSALTPNSMVGKSRGPKSRYELTFSLWLQAFMLTRPTEQWLPVSLVKQVALDQGAASESWWNKHSSDHMQKENINGVWMCRPKASPA
ncbi:AAA family ATPase [Sphingomonas sp.]|uniref:AAA family ATPase n=1 Tax=Sphingomonas sp. TaxID=28214 RepID=UPI001B073780|nr:AAA family ATPase [Sphingomonas sp.]MBO9712183.1 AAA family ATPase [Sphingomonas sp.]